MTPTTLLSTAIIPALSELAANGVHDSMPARRFLLAIALQESGLTHRRQVGAAGIEDGPAASFWQFEKGGGCRGVLAHTASGPHMRRICSSFNVAPDENSLWDAMRYQDIVAAAAARLLVLTLPSALPNTAGEAWTQYIAAWRPGKPKPGTWSTNWAIADNAVR